jgi:hypothetical protein
LRAHRDGWEATHRNGARSSNRLGGLITIVFDDLDVSALQRVHGTGEAWIDYRARILLHAGQPRRVPTTPRIRPYTFATAA